MSEVPKMKTPLGSLELAAVLRDAHHNVFGVDIPKNRLAMAWAQCALEHGRGAAIFCHNLGNITAPSSWAGDYYAYHFTRKENPHDAPAGDSPTFVMKFRAHADFVDGARDYWRVISGRYASCLPHFDAGDAAGAAHALKLKGYYTANEADYARNMVALFAEFNRKIWPSL